MNTQARSGLRCNHICATASLIGLLLSVSSFAHADVGTVTTLHSFSGAPDGAFPTSSLTPMGDGTYLGTTSLGGNTLPAGGTVFRVSPTGVESVLHSFPGTYSGIGNSDGAYPGTGLVLIQGGNFLGTTPVGGSGGLGVLFELSPTGQETLLSPFSNGADGGLPTSPLVPGSDGRYYVVSATNPYSSSFGSYANGLVFAISPPGAPFPGILHVFTGGADGAYPQTLIKGSDGNFYGTTAQGGANGAGSVFEITPTGTLTTVHSFGNPNSPFIEGYLPEALIQGSDGNFYGTTLQGGASGYGTVFQLTPAGTLTILYSFKGSPDGSAPASLIQGSDGNFYGTTRNGGLSWAGTVFELTPGGVESTLYSLHGIPGSFQFNPWQGLYDMPYEYAQPALLEIGKGSFLGTGYSEGQYNQGSVYQLTVSSGSPAPEVRIASPQIQIYPGSSFQLFWSSIGTSACTASGSWSGSVATTGTQMVTAGAPGNYTYTLTCNTAAGTVTGSTTINVQTPPAPYIYFPLGMSYSGQGESEMVTVIRGSTLSLQWSTAYATSCTAGGAWSGSVPTAGSQTVGISKLGKTTYSLTCSGLGGTTSVALTVQVVAKAPAITSFTISPSTISLGSTSKMQWTSTGARSCVIELNGTEKTVQLNGQTYLKPTASGFYTYSLVCNNGMLGAEANATLTVN
jgi:uncharacterized repeat protein (TIGR03803 family)